MAQKVQIILVDDIDGSEASQTVAFGLDGANYEIDLNDEHANALREALSPYLGHARKVSGRKTGGAKVSQSGPSAREIRDWARSNGHSVPERGRIPADVREAFLAARG